MGGPNGVDASSQAAQTIVQKTAGKRTALVAGVLLGATVAGARTSRRNKGRFGNRRLVRAPRRRPTAAHLTSATNTVSMLKQYGNVQDAGVCGAGATGGVATPAVNMRSGASSTEHKS